MADDETDKKFKCFVPKSTHKFSNEFKEGGNEFLGTVGLEYIRIRREMVYDNSVFRVKN